jgi:hypothetical protein
MALDAKGIRRILLAGGLVKADALYCHKNITMEIKKADAACVLLGGLGPLQLARVSSFAEGRCPLYSETVSASGASKANARAPHFTPILSS